MWYHRGITKGKAVVYMLTSMESYLRRGQRGLQRLLVKPWLHTLAMVLACSGGGFFLSAGGLLRHAQPLALGFIAALGGWQAVAAGVGGAVGYWVFWQTAGLQGIVWAGAGGLLGAMLTGHVRSRDQPLLVPAIAAFLTAVTALAFQTLLGDDTAPAMVFLQVGLSFFSCLVFTQALERASGPTDWLVGCMGCLCLCQVGPWGWPGYALAGYIAVAGSLPGAVLAGLGVELARASALPAAGVLGLAWLMGLVPWERRWLRCLLPGGAYLAMALLLGSGAYAPIPALVVGGGLGYLLPLRPRTATRPGSVGNAQVRLELGARVMGQLQEMLMQSRVPPIDREAILRLAGQRACAGCSARNACPAKDGLTPLHLENPLEVDCRKQGRLIPELRRGQEQLKRLKADHLRQEEYRTALAQQYRFLGEYLRSLADELPRREPPRRPCFRVAAAVRSTARERANGDRCLAFPGTGCRYYIALCDGMGTGLDAAQAGQSAGELLRQMLGAGMPAGHAVSSLNSILLLTGSAGAVTIDLAELHLDTGCVTLFKQGAAPSWLLKGDQAKKIGTATPPPGFTLAESGEMVEKLSLSRGEVLVMLSDGVDGEEIPRRMGRYAQGPPGELAAHLLHGGRGKEADDATVAVIRLDPLNLAP